MARHGRWRRNPWRHEHAETLTELEVVQVTLRRVERKLDELLKIHGRPTRRTHQQDMDRFLRDIYRKGS